MASDLMFIGQFIASKAGKTGLTVTVDVDRYTISDGSRTALVTGGSATEGRRGLYHYRLASADLSLYQYVATFVTADSSVDQQEVAALGLVVPDVLVGSRLATAGYTAPPSAADNATAVLAAMEADPPAVNVEQLDGVTAPVANLVLALQNGGYVLARLADAVSHGGGSAELTLKKAILYNPEFGGIALLLSGDNSSGGRGISIVGGWKAIEVVGDIDADLADKITAIKLITDTLDVSAVTQVPASSAGHLTITRSLTFAEAVTGLTIPADWVTAIWTVKRSPSETDSAAIIQMRVSNPDDVDDGLQTLNSAALVAPITAADGALVVTQASGRIDIMLTDELTAQLERATGFGWDVKFIDASGDSCGERGTADVVLTETQATS